MAKRGKHGELNWHQGQKCWYKKRKDDSGKYAFRYFGSKGKGPGDRACKKAALKEYEAEKAERDALATIDRVHDTVNAVEQGIIPVTSLGPSPYEQNMLLSWTRDGLIDTNGYVKQDAAELSASNLKARQSLESRLQTGKPKPTNGRKTISKHVDAWLADEGQRVPANLTESGLTDKRRGIVQFRKFVGTKHFGKAADVDQMLVDYRAHVNRYGFSPHTFNARLKFAKQFIEWAWLNNILKDQPRQLKKFATKLHTEKQGKPLTVAELKKLWTAAGPRMRCYMALGLGCGFKNGDITSLTGKMIQGKRLIGIREKTKKLKVPMNYPLWPMTLKLIEQERDKTGDDELLFVNSKGTRINTSVFSSLFKKVAKKAGVTATFEQLRDTSTELVRKQTLGEPGLLQIFLAHTDSSTAAYYTSNDPSQLKAPKLDKIVMAMEKTYGLELDAASAKPHTKKKTRAKPKTKNPKPPKTPPHPKLRNLRK